MALNLSFSGAGFMGIYHVGVASCLKVHGQDFLKSVDRFSGSSAGSMVACCLLCDTGLEQSVEFIMGLASKATGNLLGPLSPSFDPASTVREVFMKHLPPDAYQLATGRLFISLTRVEDMKNVVVSEFGSNKELVDAIVCSSFIPFFSGVIPPKFKGVSYMDGGFTDNLPAEFPGTTVTVSPWAGESDICPNDASSHIHHVDFRNTSVQISAKNAYRMGSALFPPNADILCAICKEGFQDTLKYLHVHYPNMLNVNIALKGIPSCLCEDDDDDVDSICSCSTCLTDVESSIAEHNIIAKLVPPAQLEKILVEAQAMIGDIDWPMYFARTFFNIARWMAKPYIYSTCQVMQLAQAMLSLLLPKVYSYASSNFYIQKLLDTALSFIPDFEEKNRNFERHPSVSDVTLSEMFKAERRIMVAQRSMVALTKAESAQVTDTTLRIRKTSFYTTLPPIAPDEGPSCSEIIEDDEVFPETSSSTLQNPTPECDQSLAPWYGGLIDDELEMGFHSADDEETEIDIEGGMFSDSDSE